MCEDEAMKEPLFVRSLTESERAALYAGLRSSQAVTLRRSQILLASAARQTPRQISRQLGCTDQTVRNGLRALARNGLACLQPKSSRPLTVTPELDEAKRERLRALWHHSPRPYGKARSLWTLNLVADVCFEQGLTRTRVSDETIRSALRRLGVRWPRAREWITRPAPAYRRKQRRGIG
jgi:transposase